MADDLLPTDCALRSFQYAVRSESERFGAVSLQPGTAASCTVTCEVISADVDIVTCEFISADVDICDVLLPRQMPSDGQPG